MHTQVHDLIAEAAARRGAATALTFKDISISYEQLWLEVRRMAAGLLGLGLAPQHRVAIFLDKRPEMVSSMFGAAAAGAVFVPVNPLLRSKQVAYILRDSGARVLVTSADRLALLGEELATLPELRHVVLLGDPNADSPNVRSVPTSVGWSDLLSADPAAPLPRCIDQDVAAILYTSGSTGSPKGVVLSHRNLIVGAESVSEYLGNREDDVILAALPLSFDAGLSQVTTAFSVGAHVVLLNYVLPGDVVRLCVKHEVTGLTGVPPLWSQLLEKPWPAEATRSMRYVANTGGRMPKTTLDRIRATFPDADPFLMYGLTEAFRSTYLDPSEVDRRPDSIGKAIPNAEIHVVRPDGTPCNPGEPGELVHRGALVALGYWNDPERTAQRFRPLPPREGVVSQELSVWSGDTVTRDEDGFLYFVGRTDEMIKTSGYRVSPTEVEEAAHATGLVRDAVALGVEDERLGQHIVLITSLVDGRTSPTDDLMAALRQTLPLYMVPHELVVRSELPRSPNGKLDRALLREELSP